MMAHAKAGVDKGMASPNRMPVEVMGYVQAYIDPSDEHCIMCASSSPFLRISAAACILCCPQLFHAHPFAPPPPTPSSQRL